MKAVVLEIRGAYAAVLREDGVVEKIRRSCQVGETIELEEKKVVAFPKRMGQWTAAAVAALILLTGGGVYGYNNAYAYSYVTVDANPSIEYVLNRKNELLRVTALNEDAEAIVESLMAAGVKDETIYDAIGDTTALLYESGYLGEDGDNCLVISVTSRGEAQAQTLLEEIETYCGEHGEELTVFVTEATPDEARNAQKLGVSTGRYKLAEDIVGGESGITSENAERFGSAPVRELIEERGVVSARESEMPAERTPENTDRPTESDRSDAAGTERAGNEASVQGDASDEPAMDGQGAGATGEPGGR